MVLVILISGLLLNIKTKAGVLVSRFLMIRKIKIMMVRLWGLVSIK